MKRHKNQWYKVLWRRIHRNIRIIYLKINKKRYNELLKERRGIACKVILTHKEEKELRRINILLGNGPLYIFSKKEIQDALRKM